MGCAVRGVGVGHQYSGRVDSVREMGRTPGDRMLSAVGNSTLQQRVVTKDLYRRRNRGHRPERGKRFVHSTGPAMPDHTPRLRWTYVP